MAPTRSAFPETLRFERKLLAPGLSLVEVLTIVRTHPGMFVQAFPDRQVNNLYLDSPGLRSFVDHVRGLANRSKTRIRWYGPGAERAETPVLEEKIKAGSIGGKRAYTLPPLDLTAGLGIERLRPVIEAARLPDEVRARVDCLVPTLVNRYRRCYFRSADGALRLTVDSELGYGTPRAVASAGAPLPGCGAAVILELKYAPEHSGRAADVTAALPFRIERFSKYVHGIEWIGPR